MNITAIVATCGRHTLLERSVRYFLNQAVNPEHDVCMLIYNNSNVSQTLDNWWQNENPNGNLIIKLVNDNLDSATGKQYTSLGSIYNDALKHVDADTELITHWDDDDTFLPNHIQSGIEGYERALGMGKLAYKPEKSYYRHSGGVELMGNNLEPSIFVNAQHLRLYGYSTTTTDQHLQWLNPLMQENKLYVDPNGEPTLIYDWNNDVPTWKTSGASDNFGNYRNFSKDHGDLVITPAPRESVTKYYI